MALHWDLRFVTFLSQHLQFYTLYIKYYWMFKNIFTTTNSSGRIAHLFYGCSVDMFGWICFEKHDSGCIFRMIYIDKPFKYTLPCPYMILPQVVSMAASAWCYHCSSYPGYTQWRFFFQGFLHVYFICFSAIFMIPWIYSAWKSRHWNLEKTKLKSVANLDLRHQTSQNNKNPIKQLLP